MQPPNKFEHLDSLIGGWFHQDFDIEGNTPQEVMAAYKRHTPPGEQRSLLSDIRAYLAEHPADPELEDNFHATFHPELVRGAFGMSTREFLQTIEASLNV
jgi:hypothetical protein